MKITPTEETANTVGLKPRVILTLEELGRQSSPGDERSLQHKVMV